ncbi:MAG: hypothetical protein IJ874_00265 [Ruminococcus sp.]|nr:hypothetical protein [Ruminococcus sp.]
MKNTDEIFDSVMKKSRERAEQERKRNIRKSTITAVVGICAALVAVLGLWHSGLLKPVVTPDSVDSLIESDDLIEPDENGDGEAGEDSAASTTTAVTTRHRVTITTSVVSTRRAVTASQSNAATGTGTGTGTSTRNASTRTTSVSGTATAATGQAGTSTKKTNATDKSTTAAAETVVSVSPTTETVTTPTSVQETVNSEPSGGDETNGWEQPDEQVYVDSGISLNEARSTSVTGLFSSAYCGGYTYYASDSQVSSDQLGDYIGSTTLTSWVTVDGSSYHVVGDVYAIAGTDSAVAVHLSDRGGYYWFSK